MLTLLVVNMVLFAGLNSSSVGLVVSPVGGVGALTLIVKILLSDVLLLSDVSYPIMYQL